MNKSRNSIKSLACSIVFLVPFMVIPQTMAGWDLQWIDPFDGSEVDWNNWTAQVQANFNGEVQCYTDDDSSPQQNFEVSGGTLKIIARKMNVNCAGLGGLSKSWTSGRLNSKDKREFLYGRIESRIRFYNLEGGTWPAFWMLENRIHEDPIAGDDDNVGWPNPGAGEIDVWEWYGNSPSSYITNFFNTGGCGSEIRPTYPAGSADVNNWHSYAIEWTADRISFFRDDTQVATHDMSGCAQYQEPMFVLLNLAMGGALGGAIDSGLTSATLEIDYVAHCTSTSANSAPSCNEQTSSYADDDGDGVGNDIDQCLNTAPGATVDADGCVVTNSAPLVSLQVNQDGKPVLTINPAGEQVVVSAVISDADSADTHTLSWSSPQIIGTTETGNTLSFDPTGLSEGDYNISLEVTDNGTPAMSANISTTLTVNANTASPAAIDQFPPSGSGSVSLSWLGLLFFLLVPDISRHSNKRRRPK